MKTSLILNMKLEVKSSLTVWRLLYTQQAYTANIIESLSDISQRRNCFAHLSVHDGVQCLRRAELLKVGNCQRRAEPAEVLNGSRKT